MQMFAERLFLASGGVGVAAQLGLGRSGGRALLRGLAGHELVAVLVHAVACIHQSVRRFFLIGGREGELGLTHRQLRVLLQDAHHAFVSFAVFLFLSGHALLATLCLPLFDVLNLTPGEGTTVSKSLGLDM